MAQRNSKSENNKPVAGCLIWFVLLLIVLLLFVFNWEKIKTTIENTRFGEAISEQTETKLEDGDGSLEPIIEIKDEEPKQKPKSESTNDEPITEKKEPEIKIENKETETKPKEKPEEKSPNKEVTEKREKPVLPVEKIENTRISSLYFVKLEDDGTITRHEVKRTLSVSDSPMTDALNALLQGPNTDEISRGLISLIPSGVKLISATVRSSTAYINLNEDFMYNRYGIEGYAGQIKQIVYTATSFSTVKDVQILIEGQKYEYLGGDGVYIGRPLARSSF